MLSSEPIINIKPPFLPLRKLFPVSFSRFINLPA
jgi:hypothetical protein